MDSSIFKKTQKPKGTYDTGRNNIYVAIVAPQVKVTKSVRSKLKGGKTKKTC